MAGTVLTDECSSLLPLIFELIMYLKYNKHLWTIDDAVEANRRRMNNSQAAKKRQAIGTVRLEQMKADGDWNTVMSDVHGEKYDLLFDGSDGV